MMVTIEIEREVNDELISIVLTAVGTARIVPAKLSGHPDNWAPDESECEIESVTDEKGNDWLDKITKSEYEDIVDKLFIEADSNIQEYD